MAVLLRVMLSALIGLSILTATRPALSAEPNLKAIFENDNLVAWCIVPFDAKKRSPEDRAAMLKKLGFKKYAYDWRAEHLPTFDREIEALKKNGVELTAVWFPGGLNKDAQALLDVIKKHGVKTQLWVSMGGGSVTAATPEEQKKRVTDHARAVKAIADEAAKIGCTVALYNHGGWFGEPENQLAIIDELKLPNVGIVYNLHHGHDHLARFPELLKKMKPHLLALNLNGMIVDGERKGKKILPLGQGDLDLGLLKTIRDSGWSGPIGILGHTNDDAEERLQDNLEGFKWLLPQLDGKPAGAKPKPRTMSAAPPIGKPTGGWLADGKPEYRTAPLTVECRVNLKGKGGYNILVACDTKASSNHWELFTTPANGHFTAYMPGCKPDHIHGKTDIADGKIHTVVMQMEAARVRLFVDGKKVADQEISRAKENAVPGGLAFARLVEGGFGLDGALGWVRISKGIIEPAEKEPTVEEATVGFWKFGAADQPAQDLSTLKNAAKVAISKPPAAPVIPPDGPHLKPADATLKAVLIDRSADDAYLAVKADGAGRLFVGGRDAVFVFEPNGKGGFQPRRELLRFPPDSIIIGLEYRGDDLYVLTVNALYLVPGGRTKREGLSPKRLLWGLPQDLHISFHCLTWGPEGDLYLDHGDPLLGYGDWSRPDHWGHWTLHSQPEGTKIPYTGTGAILRVRPDGTNLKVIAGGLRGPVGLAFDRDWNLFTNDNDHESKPDQYAPARLLHVTPHIDFGWPRGWMASKSPERSDLVEPVNSVMGRGVPCDQIYYDEPLIPALRGNLLLCRWDRTAVTRFPLRPRGATFKAEEIPFLIGSNNGRPTGITADRVGRLFVTTHYLGGNVVVPHCISDLVMITRDDAPAAALGDEVAATADQLWDALSSQSGEGRRRAHNELLRRGDTLRDEAMRRLEAAKEDDLALAHLPWLAAATESDTAATALAAMVRTHPRPEVRLQALRALMTMRQATAHSKLLLEVLDGPSDPARLAVLAWLIDAPTPLSFDTVAALATSTDPYLRQTASTLLARRATLADLEKLAKSENAPTRLAASLAAGIRLTVPLVHEVLPKEVALQYPAGNAFFQRKLRFADVKEPIDLADLGRIGSYTTAQRWKALPPTEEQTKLFNLLMNLLDDPSAPVKSQAAYYLGLTRDPRSEPGVDRVTRELRGGGLAELPPTPVPSAWLAGVFPGGLEDEHPPQKGPIDLAAVYEVQKATIGWKLAEGTEGQFTFDATKYGASFAYFRIQSRSRQPALLTAKAIGTTRVWHNGRSVSLPADGAPTLLDLQPGSNELLIRTNNSKTLLLTIQAKERVTAAAPEKADAALLSERLKSSNVKVGPEFLAVNWEKSLLVGDKDIGRQLFGKLGCAKCHAITADQAGAGAPSLADVGKRFTPTYLVESILTPDKQVADEFRTTILTLTNGQTVSGLLVRETAGDVEMILPDTSRKTVKLADIEERRVSKASPMPSGLLRTPTELRDLLSYMMSERPSPP